MVSDILAVKQLLKDFNTYLMNHDSAGGRQSIERMMANSLLKCCDIIHRMEDSTSLPLDLSVKRVQDDDVLEFFAKSAGIGVGHARERFAARLGQYILSLDQNKIQDTLCDLVSLVLGSSYHPICYLVIAGCIVRDLDIKKLLEFYISHTYTHQTNMDGALIERVSASLKYAMYCCKDNKVSLLESDRSSTAPLAFVSDASDMILWRSQAYSALSHSLSRGADQAVAQDSLSILRSRIIRLSAPLAKLQASYQGALLDVHDDGFIEYMKDSTVRLLTMPANMNCTTASQTDSVLEDSCVAYNPEVYAISAPQGKIHASGYFVGSNDNQNSDSCDLQSSMYDNDAYEALLREVVSFEPQPRHGSPIEEDGLVQDYIQQHVGDVTRIKQEQIEIATHSSCNIENSRRAERWFEDDAFMNVRSNIAVESFGLRESTCAPVRLGMVDYGRMHDDKKRCKRSSEKRLEKERQEKIEHGLDALRVALKSVPYDANAGCPNKQSEPVDDMDCGGHMPVIIPTYNHDSNVGNSRFDSITQPDDRNISVPNTLLDQCDHGTLTHCNEVAGSQCANLTL